MRTKTVRVVDYDATWPDAFGAARDELRGVLPEGVSVHHVGSTSVPGLAAKPVIDILVEAPDLRVIDAAEPSVVSLAYESRGEYGIAGRRYFSRPEGAGPRVHLHAFAAGHEAIARHLLFRDFLHAHPEEASRYETLKKTLAEAHARDRDAYQSAKAHFIETLHGRASDWRATGHDAAHRRS